MCESEEMSKVASVFIGVTGHAAIVVDVSANMLGRRAHCQQHRIMISRLEYLEISLRWNRLAVCLRHLPDVK